MPKKKKDTLKELGNIGIGLGKTGTTLGVSAAVAGRATALSPHAAPAMGGFGMISSGASIASTAMVGGSVLGSLKDLNKKHSYKSKRKK